MSHFTVLVIGDNIEEQLAPFQENNMGNCPEKYLEFNNKTEEVLNGWESESIPGYFKKGVFESAWGTNKKRVSVKEIYRNIEDFCINYYGYKREGNAYGYWENPNAKWDWYSIGGRWTGFFKLKEGASGKIGYPGVMTEPALEGYADQARKKDIDFENMMLDVFLEAKEEYELIIEDFLDGDLGDYKPWSYFRDREDFPMEMNRKEYWAQEQIKTVKDKKEKVKHISSALFNGLDAFYGKTKEEYAKEAAKSSISTFAVLKDGEWHEKGNMGWFGISMNEKKQKTWNEEFLDLLEEVSDDTLLTVVDCHI